MKKPAMDRTNNDIKEIDLILGKVKDSFISGLEKESRLAVGRQVLLQEIEEGGVVFDFGATADRAYIVIIGSVVVEVPTKKGSEVTYTKVATIKPGHVFGELGLMADQDSTRRARCLALKPAKLLVVKKESYRAANSSGMNSLNERLHFLASVEHNLLADVAEADLRVIAACLTHRIYRSHETIIEQGEEVDQIIFIKSGFGKLLKQLDSKFAKQTKLHALRTQPYPNPFEPDEVPAAEGASEPVVGRVRESLKKLMKETKERERLKCPGPEETETLQENRSSVRSVRLPATGQPQPRNAKYSVCLSSGTRASTASTIFNGLYSESDFDDESTVSTVLVGTLSRGQSFGLMEMLECLPYQCSVVADGYTEIFALNKYELVRRFFISKQMMHKFFGIYKMALSDEKYVERLIQMKRWNEYKRSLIQDISLKKAERLGSFRNGSLTARENAPSRLLVGSALSARRPELHEEDYLNIGGGSTFWRKRAQTPPLPLSHISEDIAHYKVAAVTTDEGTRDIALNVEYTDSSMLTLDEKVRKSLGRARSRDRARRATFQQQLESRQSISSAKNHGASRKTRFDFHVAEEQPAEQ